jgi:hypothetical protein
MILAASDTSNSTTRTSQSLALIGAMAIRTFSCDVDFQNLSKIVNASASNEDKSSSDSMLNQMMFDYTSRTWASSPGILLNTQRRWIDNN